MLTSVKTLYLGPTCLLIITGEGNKQKIYNNNPMSLSLWFCSSNSNIWSISRAD